MTDWIQTTLLAFVQGVTEFLPVSSSAHLALPAILSPAMIQRSLLFDAALHGGTLAAALVFFRQDLVRLFVSCFWQTRGGANVGAAAAREDRHFVAMLALAALPVLAAGYLLADIVSLLHRLPVIAGTTFVFGLFLWHAVRVSQQRAKSGSAVAGTSCEKIHLGSCTLYRSGASPRFGAGCVSFRHHHHGRTLAWSVATRGCPFFFSSCRSGYFCRIRLQFLAIVHR